MGIARLDKAEMFAGTIMLDGSAIRAAASVLTDSNGRRHYDLTNRLIGAAESPSKPGGATDKSSVPTLDGASGGEINLFLLGNACNFAMQKRRKSDGIGGRNICVHGANGVPACKNTAARRDGLRDAEWHVPLRLREAGRGRCREPVIADRWEIRRSTPVSSHSRRDQSILSRRCAQLRRAEAPRWRR